MNNSLHSTGQLWTRLAFLFTLWLHRLIRLMTGAAGATRTSLIMPLYQWHRMLSARLANKQRAYLILIGMGLLAPSVTQAQINVGLGLTVPTPAAVCLGQPVSLTLVPSGLLNLNNLANVTVTNNGNPVASALGSNGILTLTGTDLALGANILTVRVAAAGLAVVTANVTVTTLQVPALAALPVALPINLPVNGVVSLSNVCGTATPLLSGLTTINGLDVTLTNLPQTITVTCQGSNGCNSAPVQLTIPAGIVPLVTPVLNLPTLVSCVGQDVNVQLDLTNGGASILGQLNLANVSVRDANNTTINVSALSNTGVLTLSAANLASAQLPLTVTVSALNGFASVSTQLGLTLVPLPAAPTAPAVLTALTGGSVSLAGLCPLGSVLVDAAGNLLTSVSVTSAAQTLSLQCRSVTGNCLSTPISITIPPAVVPVLPTPVLNLPALVSCVGQDVNVQLDLTNGGASILGQLNLANVSVRDANNTTINVSALSSTGVLTLSAANLAAAQLPLTVTVSALNGFASVSAQLGLTLVPLPAAPTAPAVLTALTGGSVSLAGLCPLGSVLVDAAGNLLTSVSVTSAAQTLSLQCRSVTGNCLSTPISITIPPAVVPVLPTPVLNLPALVSCVGQDVNVQLDLTNGGASILGQLNLANVSVRDANNTTINVSALSSTGVLTLSAANLAAAQLPLTVTVSALNGFASVSAQLGLTLVPLPAAPTAPAVLTALTGGSVSLAGLCPLGSVLVDAAGNLLTSVSVTSAAQTLSLQCRSVTGNCLSTPISITIPPAVVPVLPTPVLNLPALVSCVGQDVNVQLDLTNGGASILGQLNLANVSVRDANNTTINVSALSSTGVLTLSAANLASAQLPLTVTVSALNGFASVNAQLGLTLVPLPAAPGVPATLTALTGGSVSLAGLCPLGSVLVDAAGNLLTSVSVTSAAQTLSLQCRSVTGNCLSTPISITIPPAVVPVLPTPVLNLPALVSCVGQDVNVQLDLTNGGASILGQLNLANVSVRDANNTTINVSALSSTGVLTLSAANLASAQLPLTVTVSALNGFASVNAQLGLTLVPLPAAPGVPATLTALTGGSVSLAGLCPLGSVLVDAAGNLLTSVSVTSAAQTLSLQCRSVTGNCLSTPISITIPPAVVPVLPTPVLNLPALVSCVGQDVNVQLDLTNGGASILGQLNLANVSVRDANNTTINVSALSSTGVLTLSAANLASAQLPLTVTVSALNGFASVNAQLGLTLVPLPAAPGVPATLTALTGGSVSLAGLCPLGSVLVDAAGNLLTSVSVTSAAQTLSLQCRSVTGNCLSTPISITIPPAVVPVLPTPVLNLPALVSCVGQDVNVQLDLTNGGASILGQLNLANVSVRDANNTTINVSALSSTGVLTLSAANLASAQLPLTVTVSALNGFASVNAQLGLTLVPLPAAPGVPATLTALTGGSVSLAGLCPLGSVLVDAAGNLLTSVSVTSAAQTLSLQCRSVTGNCLSTPISITIPPAVVPVLPTPVLNLPALVSCVGQDVNVQLDLTNGGASILGQLNLANVSVRDANNTTINVSALSSTGVLTLSAANLASAQLPLTVTVSALNGFASVNAQLGLTLVPLPAAPGVPATLTALTGGSVSLAGLCPLGSVLVDAAGNLLTSVSVTSAAQTLSLQCRSVTGNCLSTPISITIPPAVVPVLPTPVLNLPALVSCVGQDVNVQLDLTNGGASILGQLNLANVSVRDANNTTINVSALSSTGVLTLSAANLASAQLPLTVTVSALNGFASVNAQLGLTLVPLPAAPGVPATLTALTGGSVSLAGLCPLGSVLVDAAGNLLTSVSVTSSAQTLSLQCRSVTGNCLSTPISITIPPAIPTTVLGLNVLGPVASCLNQPISLTLVPTGGLLLSQLNLANITVTTPNGGTLALSTLGSNGVLALSSQGLSTGLNTLTLTASVLNQPVVSSTVNLSVVANPGAPSQPGLLTATVGNTVSLAALCPVGVLVDASTLSVLNLNLPVTAAVQNLTVVCLNNPCISLPTVLTVAAGVVTPVFNVSAAASICLGQPLSLTVLPANFGINDGVVSLAISGPLNATISALNSQGVATITGLPAGNQNLTITATVAGQPVVSTSLPINVISLQAPVVVTAAGQSYPAGQSSLSVVQNTGNVIFTASCAAGTPTYTGSNGSTGTGDITASTSATGVVTYSVVCAQGGCVSPATVVSLTVNPAPVVNQPPTLVNGGIPSPQSATVGVGFTLATGQYFTDPNGDPLTFTQTGLPASLSISPSGVISGTPTVVATYTVTVTATDPGGLSVPSTFTLNVVPQPVVNQPPVLANGGIPSPQSATVGVGFVLATGQYFTDPNNDPLTFTQTGLPASLSISPSGVISGTPTAVATYTVTVTATDPGVLSVPSTFTLNVVPAPVVTPVIPIFGLLPLNPTVCIGNPLSVTVTGLGALSNLVDITLSGGTATLTRNGDVLTLTNLVSGPQTLTLTASLLGSAPVSVPLNLTVLAPATPVIATAQTLVQGVGSVALTAIGCAPGETLLFSNGTGRIDISTPGVTTLTVSCQSQNGLCVGTSVPVSVTVVQAPNQAPVLVNGGIPSPQSATVGVGFTLATGQYFTDPNGDPLTFTQTGLPASLSISPSGVISGTPTTVATYTVTVTATDPGGLSVPSTFTLNVVPAPVVNVPPVLANGGIPSPQSATVGVGFTLATGQYFTDPNGDPLVFTQTGLPASLSISPSGVISGTPTTVATYTVTVTATDPGGLSVPSTFTLNVVPAIVPPITVGLNVLGPVASCLNQPISLTLVPTGGLLLSQLNLANITVTTPNGGTLALSTLGSNGVLALSSQGLSTGLNTLTLTASVLNQPVVSSTVNLSVVANPGAPSQPGLLTATVGNTVSLAALCPVGVLVDASTLSVLNLNLPVTAAVQNLTVVCLNNPCISLPTVLTVAAGVVTPVFNVSAAASICLGQPLSLTVLPANFGINDGVVSLAISGPLNATISALNSQGVATITGLPAGNQNLTITATVAGQPVVSTSLPINVISLQAPVVVTAAGQSYPAGQSSLSVVQNTGNVIFTASCAAGTPTYTGSNGSTGTGDITASTSATGVVTYSVVCAQGGCVSPATVVSLTVNPAPVVNQPPALVNGGIPSPQSATVGVGFTLATGQYFTDPNGDPLTFTQTGLPASLSISPSGVISGTPTTVATYTVTVTATDPGGLSVPSTFTLNVVPAPVVNVPPVLANGGIPSPQSATVGVGFVLATGQYFTDPNNDPLTFTQTGLPASLSISPSGVISGTPTAVATYTVTVTATDPGVLSVPSTFTLNVVPAPVVTPVIPIFGLLPLNPTVCIGNPLSVTVTGLGALSNLVDITLSGGTATLTRNGDVLTLTNLVSGPQTLTLTASLLGSAPVSVPLNLTVLAPATPVIATAQTLVQGVGSVALTAIGCAPGETLLFSNGTGRIDISTPGVTTLTVSCQSQNGLCVGTSVPVSVTVVQAPNQAPVLVNGGIPSPQSATVGVGFTLATGQYFTDPNGDPLTFTQTGLPASLSISPSGVISGTPTTVATYTVTVTATDPGGLSVPSTFTLNVVPAPVVNVPPVLANGGIPSPQSATVGVGFTLATGQYFTDPNGDPLTFTQTGLPASLSISPSGVISGTPTAVATYTVTVTATDPGGLSVPSTFTLNVVPAPVVNQPPTLVNGGIPSPQSATVGVGFTLATGQYFTDPNNDPLTFTQTGLPASLSISPSGVISGTPTAVATYTVTVTATDPGGLSVPSTFTLNVVPAPVVNQPPVLANGGIPSPQSATVGVGFTLATGQYFTDPNGDPLTFTQTGLPASLSISPSGVISGTPTAVATYTVTVTATDPGGLSVPSTFTLVVVPAPVVNQPPTLVNGGIPSPQSATVGVGFTLATGQYFTDPNGDPLTFTQTGLPASLSISPSGVISGTPTTVATYTVTVTATDPGGLSVPSTFTLNVVPAPVVNVPPALANGGIPSPQSATVGVGFVLATGQYFTDPNGDPLTFTQTGLPASLSISPSGVISGTPTAVATYTVTVTATDPGGLSVPSTFTLNVVPAPVVNQPPTLVNGGIPSPQSATVGVGFTLATGQYFTDPNNDPLTFTQTGLPASLSISPSGVISGTPTAVATYTVTVTATDPGGLSVPSTFTLNVVPAPVVNQPPTLVNGGIPSPQSATVGVGFTLATGQYFTDPNGDPLTFTQTGLPASLSISPAGVISGTPTVASTYTVTVTATDPGGLSVPSTFTLNVVPAPVVNQPPVLANGGIPSPQSATVGVGFTLATGQYFTDPNGDPLTFTQTGLPASLSISPSGVISGTPTTVATYTVTVTATDPGGLSVPSTFTLVVVPSSPGVLPPMPPMLITTPIPSPQSATVGVGFTLATGQYFMDPNGDPLVFTQTGLPSSLSISPSGVISGTPTVASTYTVTVTATDPGGLSVPSTFTLNVVPAPVVNQPPVLANGGIPSPQSATVGVGFVLATGQYFTDPNNDPLTFTQTGLPASLSISPSGVISGTPTAVATYTVTVTATDPGGLSVPSTFTLNVVPAPVVNVPPVLANGGIPSPQSATVGVGFTLATGQYFTDPNGDPLVFTQTGLPSSLSISPSGVISGTPTAVATYTVTVTATDPGGLSVPSTFTLNVVPAPVVNQPPTLVNGGIPSPQSATVGVGFTLATGQYFTDPNGDPLTFTQTGLPASLSISPSGVISGTPTVVATYTVTVTATDPGGLSVPSTFTLNVVPAPVVNQPPVLANGGIPSPQSATVGVGFVLATGQYFTDPNNDPLTFTQTGLPASLSISPAGVISGTPTTVATYTVTVTATDPGGLSVPSTFTLVVVPSSPGVLPPMPPMLITTPIPSPQSATVGIGFTLATGQYFMDPNGDPLVFTQTGLPASLSISPAGVISGTPTVASTYTVTVTATDPGGLSMPSTFTLIVSPAAPVVVPPMPPMLTTTPILSPQSATVGVGYSTTTAAAFSDPTGQTLTYGAGPLPTGVTINPITGVISGTPTVPGTFSVVVTATNPQNLSVSASYALIVVPAPTVVNGPLAVTVVSYNCATGAIVFGRLGGDPNRPVEYLAVGVRGWSTDPNGVIDAPVRGDANNSTITVVARYVGEPASEVRFTFNFRAFCSGTPANQPPVVVPPGIMSPQSATVGVPFSTSTAYAFTDPEGGPLTFTGNGLPPGLFINPTTGVVSGTPTMAGTYTVTVTATDPGGLSVSTPFVLIVSPAPTGGGGGGLVDLAIPKVDVSRRTPAPGERVRYVTNLRNESGQTGTNVVIQVQMPAGFVYSTDNSPTSDLSSDVWASTPTSPGTSYDPATNQVLIRVPSIGTGETRALFFYGLVPTTQGKHYAYWQILRTDQGDPDSTPGNGFCNGEDDTQSIDTRVLIPTNTGADVELDGILMSKTSPAQNEEVSFTVPVRNNFGPSPSTNVLTKLTLPAGLSFINGLTSGVTYDGATREVAYLATNVSINGVVPFTFSARVLASSGATVKLQAEIKSADQFDYDSQFGNVLCNNYDDDQAMVVFTVSGTSSGTTTPPVSPTGTVGGPLTLIAPLYNCQTGDITFRTSGGDGTPIYFTSVGIVANSTNPNQNIGAAIRNDANSMPVVIRATQSGVTVTYTFDFRAYCAGNPGTPTGGTNHPPVMSSIPNYTVIVGTPIVLTLPAFTDPDGDPLTYTATGSPVGFALTVNNGQVQFGGTAQKEGIFQLTITGTDPGGLSASQGFLLTVLTTAPATQTPASGALELIAPQFNCDTGELTFLTKGGDGTAIEYMAAGVKAWSTSPTGVVERGVMTDPNSHVITLLARQSGVIVSYNFDFRYFCWGVRQGAQEPVTELSVKVMENPTSKAYVDVEVRGVEGKPLELRMIDELGRVWSEHRVEQSLMIEHHELPLGTSAGLYILQAVTPAGTKTVKVLKR